MTSVPGSMPNIITGFCKEVVFLLHVQLNKNIKIFINYFLGPLLFAWLLFSIYQQVMRQPRLEESWLRIRQSFGSASLGYLLAAVLLVPANWGIEALKWKLAVQPVYRLPFWAAFKATLSGVSVSITTPNRIGEYAGRIMYLPEGNRLKTISVTLAGSMAQLLVTLVAGTLAILLLKKELLTFFGLYSLGFQLMIYGLMTLCVLVALFYFLMPRIPVWFGAWLRRRKIDYLFEALHAFRSPLLTQLLLLSVLRYAVFLLQYLCVFYLFDVYVPVSTVVGVMAVVFLVMAVIPSITLLEVGLRGEISIRLMGLFSANVLGIGFASVTVWFINLILPAIVGSLLILNLRVFKKYEQR